MGSGAPRVQYAVVSSRLVTGPAVPSELDLLRREYESSLSWRITRPLRAVGRIAREARSAAPPEAIARRDFTPGRYDSWLEHFHGDTLGRIDAACRGGGAECFALFRHLDVDLWALLLTQVAVGKSRSRKRAARLRRCTSEPSCTTPSRRTACVRRTRSPFSEPTLTGDPAGSPGVFPTATAHCGSDGSIVAVDRSERWVGRSADDSKGVARCRSVPVDDPGPPRGPGSYPLRWMS